MLKETKNEQQRDYDILRDENDFLRDNSTLNSKPGPIVWVGNINVQLHKEIMVDELKKSTSSMNKYFWPQLWFREIKDEIVCKVNHTE